MSTSVSLRFCFPLMIISTQKKLRYRLILSIDIDDQRIGTSGYIYPSKNSSLRFYLPFISIYIQKI